MKATKEDINEGIMIVNNDKIKNDVIDLYNIKSGVHDVLILEICKSQLSREGIIDCLYIQQQQLIERNKNIKIGTEIGIAIIFIFLLIFIFRR